MTETSHESANTFFYFGSYVSGRMSSEEISDSENYRHLNRLTSSSLRKGSLESPFVFSNSGDETSRNNGNLATKTNFYSANSMLPQTLLQDIRRRNTTLLEQEIVADDSKIESSINSNSDNISYYKFHIHENVNNSQLSIDDKESFAEYKSILQKKMTIRSAKGTVRGVKNRVREGIATFLLINSDEKNYKEKEVGKVVVYTTNIGIVRETYQACMKVKKILRTLLVKFEERDVFMNSEYQTEIKQRMQCNNVLVPQVFADGHYIGDADVLERLNETGELRKLLRPFKSMDVASTCMTCGGYRLLPCQICKGSKKSVHRNHFTTEFVALKCVNCDEVGLVRCTSCA